MKARKAKKKASATGKSGKPRKPLARNPTVQEIQSLAYEIYVRRGRTDGQDLEDWFQAETELIEDMRKRSD